MKHLSLIFLTVLMLIPVAAIATTATPDPQPEKGPLPRLQVEGNHLVNPEGDPVTLRGVSLCSLSWHEPMKLLSTLTDKEAGWNANVVRLPIQPEEWRRLGPAAYMTERLDPAVKQCREKGIYCVVDWHEIADWDKRETAGKLENFWRYVAPRYADDPNILYEVFNEPIGPAKRTRDTWLAFRETAQPWVDMVRAQAPDTVLLVGSPHWSQMPSFAVDDPFTGENLVYVAHVYGGWKAETWNELFGDAAETIPLFVSEWGWSSHLKNIATPFYGTHKGYAKPLRDYLEERPQISWTAWSYDPKCGPAMTGGDTEMGEFVRQWLEEYR